MLFSPYIFFISYNLFSKHYIDIQSQFHTKIAKFLIFLFIKALYRLLQTFKKNKLKSVNQFLSYVHIMNNISS